MAGDPLEEGLEKLCSLWFRGEEAHRMCVEVLHEVIEKGWTDAGWGHGMKYYVAKKLREIGILAKHRIVKCGATGVKTIYVPDRKRLAKIRLVLEQLDRPWPICLD